ncbi:DUF349 domain-containing protein [Colwelliaceae bacterium BS250]
MILTKFFKAKWQHKDAVIRVEALNQFNLTEPNNIDIIKSLISSDVSELVRRAALIKFNDYSSFLDASNTNSMSSIQEFAKSQIQQAILTQQPFVVSLEQKQQFLTQCDKIAFIEQWLMVEHNEQLLNEMLLKVSKPNSLIQFFIKTDNSDLQKQILTRIDDIEQLEKITKKLSLHSPVPEVVNTVNAKILALQTAIEKPLKLRKQLQLLLSKLLALKDIHDFTDMSARKLTIEQQWQTLSSELNCFDDSEKQQVIDKYKHIADQLKKHFAVQEEAYRHQQFIAEQQALKAKQLIEFNASVKNLSLQITDAVFENVVLDESTFTTELQAVELRIGESNISDTDKQQLAAQLHQLANKLKQLPQVAECVAKATSLISKLSTLAVPENIEELNQRQPIFIEWTQEWQRINELANDVLPQSIIDARDELQQLWRSALQPLIKEQQQAFNHVGKKIAELKRLITVGKYKSAFGLHTKLTFLIPTLSDQHQQKLASDFEHVSQRINELHELEAFIVTPKKQQVLADVQLLVEQPLDNPLDQAEKIKTFRKLWNSLGHADEALDKDLNHEFNKAIELAFAPCRSFYAEQGKIREHHLAQKQNVLEQLASLQNELSAEDVNWRNIEVRLNKLTTLWRETGEIDRDQYQNIVALYRELITPIKQGINDYHQSNIDAKQALIEQAKLQLDNDDVFAAINNLKALQQQWNLVGYAGAHKENPLWQTFRKVNDQIFAQREDAKQQQQKSRDDAQKSYTDTINQLTQSIADALDAKTLRTLTVELEQLNDQIKQLKPVAKGLLNAVNDNLKSIKEKIASIKSNQEKQVYIDLFDVIGQLHTQSLTADNVLSNDAFARLPKQWQKLIKKALSKTIDIPGFENLTIELEILANVESPKNLSQQRLQVQVQLLSDKLMQGDAINLQSKLEQWLGCGLLVDITQPESVELSESCLLRVKSIFN